MRRVEATWAATHDARTNVLTGVSKTTRADAERERIDAS
jgi:hypothetical protein